MKTPTTKLKGSSRLLLVIAGICLAISIFVPIWRIDLDAPQYPEGLRLLIYSDKLGGNVDIINGLNHYIGMKTLHAEEFIEFTVLPYIIGGFALLCLLAAIIGSRKMLYGLLTAFILFGIIAMVDFWRWEYNYGHNLDPNAAIIVPGMAYQPPLIGFKQLLNFGAYSIPDIGGWLFVASGVLMVLCIVIERRSSKRLAGPATATAMLLMLMSSCSEKQPEAIKLNTDNCDYCKMTISDARFACQLITPKNRVYKFDDLSCMNNFVKEDEKAKGSRLFVSDFNNPGSFVAATEAVYVESEKLGSPMGGNTAAHNTQQQAEEQAAGIDGTVKNWDALQK